MSLEHLLNAMPGAAAQGLIWGLMAIGVYISYKILDIADLTVDGSLATGACICAVMLGMGHPVWVCLLAALAAGALTGVVTGLLHTQLGIPSILAGILTQLMLYTVNLLILDDSATKSISPWKCELLITSRDEVWSVLVMVGIVAAVIVGLYLFFYTQIGLTLKSTGDNPDMSRAQGVNVNRNKVIGLAISNAIVALAGALLAQYQGFGSINDGKGAIVIGLAAIYIGLSVSLKIKPNFVVSLIGVVCGGVVYFVIYTVVIMLGVKTIYMQMLSALIVALFIGIPYLKGRFFTRQKDLRPSMLTKAGGDKEC